MRARARLLEGDAFPVAVVMSATQLDSRFAFRFGSGRIEEGQPEAAADEEAALGVLVAQCSGELEKPAGGIGLRAGGDPVWTPCTEFDQSR